MCKRQPVRNPEALSHDATMGMHTPSAALAVVIATIHIASAKHASGMTQQPIRMEPLGVYCADCDETTPIMWPPPSANGPTPRLTMVEHHSGFRVRQQVGDMSLPLFTHQSKKRTTD